MRTLQAVLLCIAIAAAGCGDEERSGGDGGSGGVVGNEGGTGGGGGTGGAGGTGGSGGSGGSGGAAGGSGGEGGSGGSGGAVGGDCGNHIVEEGETCDDGNQVSGDGCAADCTIEGTCDAPIDWMAVSGIGTLGRSWEGVIRAAEARHEGSCGAPGGEVVYRVVAPHDGVFSLSHDSNTASVNYVRSSCGEPEAELFCRLELQAFNRTVVAGEALFFFVDLPEGVSEAEVTIVSDVFPYKAEGESCDLTNPSARCAPGLTCSDISVFRTCKVNEAPVLAAAQIFRSGDDFSVLVEGSDPNGNQVPVIRLRFFDENDVALLVEDHDRDGIPDSDILIVRTDLAPGDSTDFAWTAWVEGFFAAHPAAVRAEASVADREGVEAAWIDAPIAPLPVVAVGGACDRRERANRCEVDHVCYPDGDAGDVCRPLAAVREERCAAAPLVEAGVELEGWVDRATADGRGHWDPPDACIDRPLLGVWTGHPEGLARLHLPADARNVVISTDVVGSMNSVLYLLPGCGTDPAPLACSDDLGPTNVRSELQFDQLAAGDYLVVVDLREPSRVAAPWSLVVTWEAE